MTYIVEPLLAGTKDHLTEMIAQGVLRRWGGVLRITKGHPGAGTIYAHLRDVVPSLASAPSPLGVVQTVSSVAQNMQLHQINKTLGTVLQMTNVAAAASVLNLGVSAIGFAVMAHKLNGLQRDMNQVLTLSRSNHREVMGQLSDVTERLVELRYIGLTNHGLLTEAIERIREVRKDLLEGYVAKMLAEFNHLRIDADVSSVRSSWKAFTESRYWLTSTIESSRMEATSSETWFDLLTRYRAWCFATAGEVQLARRAGDLGAAAQLASDGATTSRRWGDTWRQAVLKESEFGGVFRFDHSHFSELGDDTRLRLRRLQGLEDDGRDLNTLSATKALAEMTPALPPGWFEQQKALAGVFDFAEETAERLESMAWEMKWCADERLDFKRWEQLEAPPQSDAVGLIKVGRHS